MMFPFDDVIMKVHRLSASLAKAMVMGAAYSLPRDINISLSLNEMNAFVVIV